MTEYSDINCYCSNDITEKKCNYEIIRSLWLAVIIQSFVDLKSQSNKKMAKINRVKAMMWVNLNNKDFITVCGYAELDPFYVYDKKRMIMRNHYLNKKQELK